MFPFQCKQCWYLNLKRKLPEMTSDDDLRLMMYMRRLNLDGFWSSRPKTVASNLNNMLKTICCMKELNVPNVLPPIEPWPTNDVIGCSQALAELRASQGKGRYYDNYVQYETIRKMRSCVTNSYQATAAAAPNESALVVIKGAPFHVIRCHTDSLFFTMFNQGMRKRMGRDVRPDRALDHRVLHIILLNMENSMKDLEVDDEEKLWLLIVGFYIIISFVLSLCGNEGFMIKARGLVEKVQYGDEEWN